MVIIIEPIGVVHTDTDRIPRHWTVSDVKGTLVIDKKYRGYFPFPQKSELYT
jgi:hypothetical protein